MHHNTTFKPRAIQAIALVPIIIALLCGNLPVFGARDVSAKQFGAVNTPPPIPQAARNASPGIRGALPVGAERAVNLNGRDVPVREALDMDVGVAVPDAADGFLWVPYPAKPVSPGLADARELRLKVRELASQLIANMDPALQGVVGLPTSFVNQEDFSQSSPLGRFIAEQMFYEFNQRCFPVREYRLAKSVTVRENGKFLLSRKAPAVSTANRNLVFVVGTYFIDRQAVFVNARLVRGDGTVLRTGQVVLPSTGVTRRMLAGNGKTLKTGSIPIRDYKTETQPTNLTPFDQGEDVH